MKRRLVSVLVVIPFMCLMNVHAEGKKVLAVRSSNFPLYGQALGGFRMCMRGRGVSYEMEEITMPDSDAQAAAFINNLRSRKPDLILALGSSAARLVKERVRDVPMVFCMVVDPPSSNLMTGGVTLDIRPAVQIDFIRKNFPQFKRIGIIYNPQRNRDVIRELKEMRQNGEVNLVFAEATSIDQMDKALQDISAKSDCLLMLSDPTIYTAQTASQLILQTLQRGVPLIAISSTFVKAGALAGIYADLEDNGCQASELAGRILEGEHADTLPISWSRKVKTAVNLVVAERLKVPVSRSTIEDAEEVVK
ncbi:MAG: hypothetical protein HY548_08250 [Elusimicrobia bacterium]|nr:hypothetical protein [Elusimicrobiota bacterium]